MLKTGFYSRLEWEPCIMQPIAAEQNQIEIRTFSIEFTFRRLLKALPCARN